MTDAIALIEEVLRTAEVIPPSLSPPVGGGGHRDSFKVMLQGPILVIVKPEDGTPEMERAVKCEVGAWTVARILGWTELVAVTVERDLWTPKGELRTAAVQAWWPEPTDDNAPPPVNQFRDDDVWKAAVFDALIHQSDRGHNYAAAPQGLQPMRLRLYDNGFAFSTAFQSVFFAEKRGEMLPQEIIDDLVHLKAQEATSELPRIIPNDGYKPFQDRLDELVKGKILPAAWMP